MTATAITSLGEETEVTEKPTDGRSPSNTNVGSWGISVPVEWESLRRVFVILAMGCRQTAVKQMKP
jgi:hypothetical protein